MVKQMNEIKNQLAGQFRRLESLLLRSHIKRANDGSAISPHRGQGRILAILKLQPRIGQKELGYLLDMSKQGLAELLGKLEKSGYITRSQSEKDRRSYIVELTDSGREALPDESSLEAEVDDVDAALDCLNEEEQRNMAGYLDRIIKAVVEKSDVVDDDDYADYFRERFFARHGVSGMMGSFGRRFGRRGGR
ncbi:MAG: MarR family transcriptional regulator [Chitinispirillales bacterium]|jgi:DNA-binding MarR family transcriptional regulator|nr:MarR family transcriptional regulator [Chitinispirillales bacterium]